MVSWLISFYRSEKKRLRLRPSHTITCLILRMMVAGFYQVRLEGITGGTINVIDVIPGLIYQTALLESACY